jgi:pimeloyl-ACP methyl ester carboxylesterase
LAATPQDRTIDVGVRLHLRDWPGEGAPFVLLHGLASSCRTWDLVAPDLSLAGHRVVAIDQRGHGLSEQADEGYDFPTLSRDLRRVLGTLALDRPILVGQSWGASVVLHFGAAHPGRARGLALVDGGFSDLQLRDGADWDRVSRELSPPKLEGKSKEEIRRRVARANPEWRPEAVEAALGCFETLPDGTVRPWLSRDRHMRILRVLWEQRPAEWYPRVREPVVLCAAENGRYGLELKRREVEAAQRGIGRIATHWFSDTAHDIQLHRPEALTKVLLKELSGIWTE